MFKKALKTQDATWIHLTKLVTSSLFIAGSVTVSIFAYICTFLFASRIYNFFISWNSCPDIFFEYRMVNYIFAVINISIALVFMWMSRTFEDVYRIKREMVIEMLIYISTYVFLFIFNVVLEPILDLDPYTHIIRVTVMTSYTVLIQVWVGLVPAVKSMNTMSNKNKSASLIAGNSGVAAATAVIKTSGTSITFNNTSTSGEVSMQQTFMNPQLRSLFEEYCTNEFTIEHFQFYEDYQKYKQLVDYPESRLVQALVMYDKYMVQSNTMITIDPVYVREINQHLQHAPIYLFDNAFNEEILCTLLDSYNRFMTTKTFTEFKKEKIEPTKVLPAL